MFAVALGMWAGTCLAEWEYAYRDTFSTDQLKADSFDHSVLGSEWGYPPAQPFLTLAPSTQQDPRLGFWGVGGVAAHLSYCFPLGSSYHPQRVLGQLEFDILPANPATMPDPLGFLRVSVSGDGRTWTIPVNLDAGHHTIKIASNDGACYVKFAGTYGFLANLAIELKSEASAIHVPADYSTIQRAIDAAAAAREVVVSPGTYWGEGNWNLELRGKPITVRSEKGAEQTILDCQGPYQGPGKLSNRAFYIHQGEGPGTVIQGFTIQYGNIPGNASILDTVSFISGPTNPVGGALYCENAGPTIADCVIKASGAEFGGGIGCVNGTPAIVNCRITGCKAGGLGNAKSGGYGGAIALLRRSEATIRACVISGNRVYYNGLGGGIYVRASAAEIAGCEFLASDSDGDLTGGGIAIGGPYSRVTADHCVIASNSAQIGSGIWIDGRHDTYTGGLTGPACQVGVTNCTVADNMLTNAMPPYPAGGIYASKADIRVRNCIVYGNGGQELQILEPAVNSPVTYSDIKGGYAGAGNTNVPPLFAPTGAGEPLDYHLQSVVGRFNPKTGKWVIDAKHSPCVDAGDLRDAYELEPEPNGHRINQGAYGDTVQASKGLGNLVYHVDGTAGNDKNDGLSRETAFKTIPKGINTARNGDIVLVWPGVYVGPIYFYGKAITLTSAADAAILTAPGEYGVSFYSGEGPESVLRNFVIRGCLGGVFVQNSSPTLTHLTIVQTPDGVLAYEGSHPSIRNCILWYNSGQDLFECKAFYSCIEDEGMIFVGSGNIRNDPLFADPQRGDFHLKSQRGRFMPDSGGGDSISSGLWILDEVTSPCVDAGDPEIRPSRERMPNGGRLNQGATGGTPFASMSDWPLSHDSTRDGRVDLADVAELAEAWLRQLAWIEPGVSFRIVKSGTDDVVSLGQGRFDIKTEMAANGVTIVQVEFYVDGILACIDFSGGNGWTCNTKFQSIGVHRICARAVDSGGGTYEAECIEMRAVE